jgi:hypothetical protein
VRILGVTDQWPPVPMLRCVLPDGGDSPGEFFGTKR